MVKKISFITIGLLLPTIVILLFLFFRSKPKNEIIGGQKDEHGCLIPAGYAWCEFKQKCLRIWVESCEPDANNEFLYQNYLLGFQLTFPITWNDYQVRVSANSVSFSFGGDRQPFSIFSIFDYPSTQWSRMDNKKNMRVLNTSSTNVLVCDGCCYEGRDTNGGGQFDAFQIDRCKEVPAILKTFKKIDTTIETFFNLIDEHKPSEAVATMSSKNTSNNSVKQAWAVQFNAFDKVSVTSVQNTSDHTYKVILDVTMKSEAVNVTPIPNYGWDSGLNTRWVSLVKENDKWFIDGISTGP